MWLLETVAAASQELSGAIGALQPDDWEATIRTATGREVTAAEIPWLRVRESVIHRLDLDLGWSLPEHPYLVDALLSDTVAAVGGKPGCPAVLLAPTDRDRTWALGPDEPGVDPLPVKAEAVQLLRWAIGGGRRPGRKRSSATRSTLRCYLAGCDGGLHSLPRADHASPRRASRWSCT